MRMKCLYKWNICTVQMELNLKLIALDLNSNLLELQGQRTHWMVPQKCNQENSVFSLQMDCKERKTKGIRK